MGKNNKNFIRINSITGLIYQLISIICGFVMPRLILQTYGSEINGMVNSITSILGIVSLMELGVGAVVQSALYKPLAEKNDEQISKIVYSAKKYFKIVGLGFVVLIFGVLIAYPFYVQEKFDYFSTFFLIMAISISLLGQYFFGIVEGLLIQADQKNYIVNIIQALVVLINTVLCAILMFNGFSIHIVKFTTSVVFLIKPIFLVVFVRNKYKIMKVRLDGNEIPQKWNGIAQHIAAYVLDNTDILILTIFCTLTDISIYSVYHLISHSLRLLIISLTSGVSSYYGYLLASNQEDALRKSFEKYNFLILSFSTLIYSIACILIVPFVLCYTKNINDANYNNYLFGVLLLCGQFFYCTRRSYNMLINAAGQFKQTQISAILEAVINVVVSIILVFFWGLIGVAIGTLIALLYRTIYFGLYCSKRIINRELKKFVLDTIFSLLLFSVAIFVGIIINNNIIINNFFEWVMCAIVVSCSMLVLYTILSLVFYRSFFIKTISSLIHIKK